MIEPDGNDYRKHQRSEFAYPVEMKLLSQDHGNRAISGYIENVSESGSGVLFEDRYGRVDVEKLHDVKMKLSIVMPNGEKVAFIAKICWIKKDSPQPFFVQLGIQFENIEDWQLDAIKKLVRVKNKDHNMMWNLWEQYERQL